MVFREGNFSPVTSYGIYSDRFFLLTYILRQVQETNKYVRHHANNNVSFQNGPKNFNKNRKDNDDREEIHKNKKVQKFPNFPTNLL